MKRTCIGGLILMALVSVATQGVETNSAPAVVAMTNSTTLEALVVDTLANNPELKFYDAEILAAKAGRKTAGLLANPEVSGSVGNKSVRGAGLSAEGVAWSVSVAQPFEWPGRIGLRKLEAVESLLDTKREALEAAQNLELLTGLAHPMARTTSEEKEKK